VQIVTQQQRQTLGNLLTFQSPPRVLISRTLASSWRRRISILTSTYHGCPNPIFLSVGYPVFCFSVHEECCDLASARDKLIVGSKTERYGWPKFGRAMAKIR